MIEIAIVLVYVILLVCILAYCISELILAINYVKNIRQRNTELRTFAQNNPITDHPFVTIQLPIFNEKYVVERLIDAVAATRWPKDRLEIQVLDDSTDETVEITAAKVSEYRALGMNIHQIRREKRTGFKAGALQEGLKQAKGEFIAIFDADFTPQPDFLVATIPHFQSPEIGVVQTRWKHINQNYSLLTKVQAFFLDAHFTVEQAGRNISGYFMNFNGTAGVWRKQTIINAGGWQSDTLTEDLDLSYRAQINGWKFVYLEYLLSPAELPADIQSFKSQQFRWIKGGAETARKILPRIAVSDLPFPIKLNAFSHLLSSSVYLVIFLTILLSVPLMLVKNSQIEGDYMHYALIFLLSNVAVAFVYYISSNNHHNPERGFWKYVVMLPIFLIVTMGLSLHNAMAVLRGLWGEKTPFIRTPKFNLLKKTDSWAGKKYLFKKIDGVTIAEGLAALYFLSAMVYGVATGDVSLFPVHLMAFLGFATVFGYSLMHYWKMNA